MRTPEQAIRNFVYFSLNYDYKFIEKCWEYDQSLVKHLREKFHMYYGKHGALGVMTEFFCNLSSGHQIRLAKWIDENYNEINEDKEKSYADVKANEIANLILDKGWDDYTISTCNHSNWDKKLHIHFPSIAEKLRAKGFKVSMQTNHGVSDWYILRD